MSPSQASETCASASSATSPCCGFTIRMALGRCQERKVCRFLNACGPTPHSLLAVGKAGLPPLFRQPSLKPTCKMQPCRWEERGQAHLPDCDYSHLNSASPSDCD